MILSGCAALREFQMASEAKAHLERGQNLERLGRYDEALIEYEKVLTLSPLKSPEEDQALFHMGLIHAHFAYPKRDYGKAKVYFIRILNDYPQSPQLEQAKIWVGVLHEAQRLSQAFESSKQAIETLNQAIDRMEKAKRTGREESKVEPRGEVQESLHRGQRLLAQGDFEGAVGEHQRALGLAHHKPPEDEILFHLGLIYAHPNNPKKDYAKSLDFFKRLIKDHPKSPLSEQAKTWVGILQENEKLSEVIQKSKQVDIEIEERKREKQK